MGTTTDLFTIFIDTAVFLLFMAPAWFAFTRTRSWTLQIGAMLIAIVTITAYTCVVPWWGLAHGAENGTKYWINRHTDESPIGSTLHQTQVSAKVYDECVRDGGKVSNYFDIDNHFCFPPSTSKWIKFHNKNTERKAKKK